MVTGGSQSICGREVLLERLPMPAAPTRTGGPALRPSTHAARHQPERHTIGGCLLLLEAGWLVSLG
jgi:hypothetical protein